MPRGSSFTASAAACPEMFSALFRSSRTSPFRKPSEGIAQKLGIALPKISLHQSRRGQGSQAATVLLEVHERACAFFQEYLQAAGRAHAREYLAGRGLNEEPSRLSYRLRARFWLSAARPAARRFDEEVLRESGVFSWKQGRQPAALETVSPQQSARSLDSARDDSRGAGQQVQQPVSQRSPQPPMYSKFRNRVMFPITNEAGRVIAFTGRTLSTDEKAGPKYLNSPETAIYSKSRLLFNLDQAQGSDPQAGLRHAGRRTDGLHLGFRRRLSQRDRQLRHRFHRASGAASGTLHAGM